jgi:hypothetical protein
MKFYDIMCAEVIFLSIAKGETTYLLTGDDEQAVGDVICLRKAGGDNWMLAKILHVKRCAAGLEDGFVILSLSIEPKDVTSDVPFCRKF